ncbi:MAG: HEAT repeat domain-containing protein [Anaerolineae bacterium]|nr:HEAT repeat domain-containing protein [Anaerolineae bacterium]
MFLKRVLTPDDVEKMKTDRNLRGLLRAFQTGSEETYLAAYQALVHYSPPPAAEMTRFLKEGDDLLRRRAARALGEMNDPRVIPALLEALTLSLDPDLSRAVVRSLDQLQWLPTPDRHGALYHCTRENWLNCLECGPAAVPPLARALDARLGPPAAEWDARHTQAISEISKVLAANGEAAVSSLMHLFTSGNPQKRDHAARVLLEIGAPAVPALLELLERTQDEALLLPLIDLLRQFRDPASVQPLLRKLLGESANVQKAISDALGEMGGEPGARALTAAQRAIINTTPWDTAVTAAEREGRTLARRQLSYIERALGAIGAEAIPALAEQLESENEVLVERTMNTLQRLGSAVNPAMLTLLRAPDTLPRARAMEMLRRLGWEAETPEDAAYAAIAQRQWQVCIELGPPARPPLLRALRFWDYALRLSAAQTLDQLGGPPQDPEDLVYYYVAHTAFASCTEMGRAAVKPLIRNLQETLELEKRLPNDILRIRAQKGISEALVSIGQAAVVDLIVVLEGRQGHLRPYAADILARIGEPAVAMLMQSAREHASADVRYEAARALYQIDQTPMEFYVDKLRDPATRIRLLAANAFHQQIDERAVKALTRLVENRQEDLAVRKAAVLALGSARDPQLIPLLTAVIGADHRDMQIAGIHALSEMGPQANQPDVIRLLIDILTDQEGKLQQDAAAALAVIGDADCASLLLDLLLRLDAQLQSATPDPVVQLQWARLEQLRLTVIRALAAMERTALLVLFDRTLAEQLPWRESFTKMLLGMGEGAPNTLRGELVSPLRARRFLAAEWLTRFQWVPQSGEGAAAYAIARQEWERVPAYGQDAVAPLVNLLDSDRETTRRKAAELLDALGWQPKPDQTGCNYWIIRGQYDKCTRCGELAVSPLVEALRETVEALTRGHGNLEALNERRNALKVALYQIGAEAVPVLVSYFSSARTDENVRVHLSHVLKYIGRPAEPALIDLLNHKGSLLSVRQQSAWALGEIKSAAAAPSLFTIIGEPRVNPLLLRDGIQALEKICAAHRSQPLLRQARQVMTDFLNRHPVDGEELTVDALRVIRFCDVALREADGR